MTLINKLLRVIPKKRVDIVELDRKTKNPIIEPIQTVKKEAINLEYLNKSNRDSNQEIEGMVNGEYEILEREIMPEKIICPDCGGLTLEGLEFCDKCGGDLTNL